MKKLILIDGENFIHQVVDVLTEAKLVNLREDLKRLDVFFILEKVLKEPKSSWQANYYAARVRRINQTPELQQKTASMIAWNAFWAPWLSNQDIKYIKAGNLLVRDGKRCSKCGHQALILQEKGVDVRIATDLIRNARRGVHLVLVSSDGDLMPAVEEAIRRGAKVTYVCFEAGINWALARNASRRRMIASKQIIEAYRRVNENKDKRHGR